MSEQTKTNLENELRIYEINSAELNEKFSRAEEKNTQLASQKEKLVRYLTYAYYYSYPYFSVPSLNCKLLIFVKGGRNF